VTLRMSGKGASHSLSLRLMALDSPASHVYISPAPPPPSKNLH
jgi:hypothetical protein